MALVKQPVQINFSKGLDTKSDPFQVPVDTFLRLENSVFDKAGRLTKRNGFAALTSLGSATKVLTTYNNNLTAVGDTLQSYSSGNSVWVNKGTTTQVSLSTLPLIRANTSQVQADTAVSTNGLICTVYTDTGTGSTAYKYAVADATTGQNILPPAAIPVTGTQTSAPRVFFLGTNFLIVYRSTVTAVETLRFVTISSTAPVVPVSDAQITNDIRSASEFQGLLFDAAVTNSKLYLAWAGDPGSGSHVKMATINTSGTVSAATTFTGITGVLASVTVDSSGANPVIWCTFSEDTGAVLASFAVDTSLATILAHTTLLSAGDTMLGITSSATGNVLTVLYEVSNVYTYNGIRSEIVKKITVTTGGSIGSATTVSLAVGLASKSFLIGTSMYFLSVYVTDSFSNVPNQNTYFLMDISGNIISRFAYSNAGNYKLGALPAVAVSGSTASVSYQFADLLIPVSKTQGASDPNSVVTQYGVNYITFTFSSKPAVLELGGSLQFSGGFLWGFDGVTPVENNFFVYPENIMTTVTTTGGNMIHQDYYYVLIYEWCDNQGNVHRSAPSIPVKAHVTDVGDTNKVKIDFPMLRLTYKRSSPVKVSIYRWSTAQPIYYEITSITSPIINNPAIDSTSYSDTVADTTIAGNSILYTTGGLVENISPPAFTAMTQFNSRGWGIDAEDPNLLWYSKQVIENTPVELSDLFTLFVSPGIGSQGPTGPCKCIAPLDDKLIIFKKGAMNYINGVGPDNTGANYQYSEPTFITATVGCSNPSSIVLIPTGLMFQSDKGIWLLDRALNTRYIGAPVETYTQTATVQSAIGIPNTNQVRITLDSGVTLLYDYFFDQWGVFTGISALSATLYNNLMTYTNGSTGVFQETPGVYLDGATPVVMKFTTSWIKTAGLIGFQRAYWLNLLGTYQSPHTLAVSLAYDYDSTTTQTTTVTPDSTLSVEQERVFFSQGKCISFQVAVDESYDSTVGPAAGAGLTLSGLNLTIGAKKAYPTPTAARSFG